MHGHCCTPPYSRWSCTCLKACSCLAAGSARVSPLPSSEDAWSTDCQAFLTFCRLAGVLGNGQLLSAVPLHDTVYRAHTYSYRSRPFTCARIVASRKPLMKLCCSAMQAPTWRYTLRFYCLSCDPRSPAAGQSWHAQQRASSRCCDPSARSGRPQAPKTAARLRCRCRRRSLCTLISIYVRGAGVGGGIPHVPLSF